MDEMNFDEFRDLMLQQWPFGDKGIVGELRSFLRSGCTEDEAKIWIGEHIWDLPDGMREQFVKLFAADSLQQAARKARQPQGKPWKVWNICDAHKHEIRSDLLNGLIARVTEDEGRKYLTDHFKELPQAMQDELTMLFFEEAIAKKNQQDNEQLERKRKFLAEAKRFEETEPERDPAKRKEKFLEFVKRFVEREGPVSLS